MLWKHRWHASNCRIFTSTKILGKLWNIIPVLLQAVRNLASRNRCPQLQDRIVVHSEILSLLVLAPDLLAFDAEELNADTSWRGNVVGHELRSEGGVAHNAVISGRLLEHALREVGWEILLDSELSDNTLQPMLAFVLRLCRKGLAYSLGLQVCSSQTVVMFIEVHHLHALELLRDLPNLILLARLLDLDALRVPANVLGGIRRHCDNLVRVNLPSILLPIR